MVRQQWQDDLKHWAKGWQAVRGNESPEQSVKAWEGSVPSDSGLVLVCESEQAALVRGAVLAAEKDVAAQEYLMAGDVQELDRSVGFPGQSGVFEAPMDDYMRFEVAEWGKPVAYTNLAVEDAVAFMGPILGNQQQERNPSEVTDALVSYVANEAFLASAERMYTVVDEQDVTERESQGWTQVAAVLRVD